MTACAKAELFSRFSEFVAGEIGLHFPPERANDLDRGIRAATAEFGFERVEDCIHWLMSAPLKKNQIEILAGNLTVGETFFLRESRVFAILEEHVLPELIRLRRRDEQRLRIWSAACCSGEEPYSIAVSVRKAVGDIENWSVGILGTDINPHFLKKASKGIFGEWSFRNTPLAFKENHFVKTANRWQIRSEIREMVSFAYLNLAEDNYPSVLNHTDAVDIIFCRNVLIYFTPDQAKKVIRKLTQCLAEGGWLVLGPNDIAEVAFPGLIRMQFAGATCYRKASSSTSQSIKIFPLQDPEEPFPAVWPPAKPDCALEWTGEPQLLEAISPASENRECEILTGPMSVPYPEALALYEKGRYAEVIQKLLAHSPQLKGNSRGLKLLIAALANQGDLREALIWSDRLIAIEKLSPSAYYLRATLLRELGLSSEAEVTLGRALYLDPDFVIAHFALGSLARTERKFTEATKHFKNALSIALTLGPEEILPESEGLTAGRIAEIILGFTDMNPAGR